MADAGELKKIINGTVLTSVSLYYCFYYGYLEAK